MMWSAAQLPAPLQRGLGRALGGLAFHLARHRRHVAETNLALCFPDRPATERARLLRAHFRSLGLGLVETAMAWWTPESRLRQGVTVEGLPHLEAALDQGRGVLLLSAHFTSLEIGGRLLALFAPFHVLYREHRNPLFEEVMQRARRRHFRKAIRRRDMRALVASLKENLPVWYAPDQDYGRRHSLFIPFFGVPAATTTATARLASLSSAPVVPFYQRRRPEGGYHLVILPVLNGFPSGDREADTRRISQVIEELVRQQPEDYLWVHRRFKTRPDGEPRPYG
jgi:KDO2-lipid IV(A) lauroyltransferase